MRLLSPTLAYDGTRDRLYASYDDWGGVVVPLIAIFDQASSAGGLAAPTRTIGLPTLNGPLKLQLDRSRDILYIGGFHQSTYSSALAVIKNASSATSLTPIKIYPTSSGNEGLAVDPQRQLLYSISSTYGFINVFDLDTLADPVPPSYYPHQANGSIRVNVVTSSGIALDVARDRLYAVSDLGPSETRASLSVVDGASTPSPRVSKVYTDAISLAIPRFVSLDEPNDRLYLGYVNSVVTIEKASSLSPDSRPTASSTFNVRAIRDTYVGSLVFP